jgi:acetyl-CoA carboxylase carboxyl transferase subunit beta
MPVPDWLRLGRPPSPQSGDSNLWERCSKCGEMLYRKDLEQNLWVCVRCGHHLRMHASDRVRMLLDGEFLEIGEHLESSDPLGWVDKRSYPAKLAADRERSGLNEAIVVGTGTIEGNATALGIMDFGFRGGTMGSVVGERIARLFEHALRHRLPVVLLTASGGARMEEGMLALMQMAKSSVAIRRFMEARSLYIAVLTDPTTGGVSASFAFQADVVIAESKASIGFAGRRVIEQTIRQRLPENFQTAEFLLEKGQIDMVVRRHDLRALLGRLLDSVPRSVAPS